MSRVVQMIVFLAVASLLLGGMHYYLWARLVRDPALPSPWRQVATTLLVVLWLSLPATMFLYRVLEARRARHLIWVPYTWLGVLLLLLLLVVSSDLVRLFASSVTRFVRGPQPPDPERRKFFARILAGAAATGAAALAGWAAREALTGLDVQEVRVPLARLPEKLDGFTIVQVSDIHFGPTIRRDFAEEIVRRCNALSPDVIAITGDLVDGTVDELREVVAPLGELRARHGVYFVTGNHEYYVGRGGRGTDEWLDHLRTLGIRPLRNERVSIGDGEHAFDLAGVDDWNARGMAPGHGPDLSRALDGRDAARELVLLAHQPRQIAEAARMGVGLQLSGHTHGGQIWPWTYLVRLQQPYVAGLHRHDESWVYVSRGTGYWGPPMRLGAPPEVTKLILHRA